MSIFRCCVGAESRTPNESSRPAAGSHSRNKNKKQTEVFFDIPKPEGQLSSVTDLANSADHKKQKEFRDKGTLEFTSIIGTDCTLCAVRTVAVRTVRSEEDPYLSLMCM